MKHFLRGLALLFFMSNYAQAQPSNHAWLETSQLKVRINADGRLFCDDEKGAFLVPLGDSMVTLMRGAGLWLGGIDPGNNLHTSIQTLDPAKTDMVAGFRGIPNSGKVWKVTRQEIEAHIRDYQDNFVIDDPIPAIFSWPAFRNPFFFQSNGFELPDSVANFAFLELNNFNGRYKPQLGDYPLLNVRRLDGKWAVPSEMAAFSFYTDALQTITGGRPYPVQVWGQAFVYDCPENELLTRSVFVQYEWRNEGEYLMDSTSVSVINDFDLGDPEDDFHGFLPGRSAYFAYNANSIDAVWGEKTPLVFVAVVDNPTDLNYFWGYYLREGLALPYLMPYPCPDSCDLPAGMREPVAPNEFYNYMTGTWRDGTTLTADKQGYNPWNPDLPTAESAYPGYPDSPDLWTELNAQNPPGNRRGLLNHSLGIAQRKSINRMTLQYSYMPAEAGTLTNRIKSWEAEESYLIDRLLCCFHFFGEEVPIGCEFSPRYIKMPLQLTVFPNPANEVLHVWHPDVYLINMRLFDALGHVVGIGVNQGQFSEISVQNLPQGIYFLEVETEKGEREIVKVMVAH